MAIKTTYDEQEVKLYMEKVLGDTGEKLGISMGGQDFDEPANEVLYILGESDFSFVSTASQAKKVRAVSRMMAWKTAMAYSAHEASFSAGAPGTGQTQRSDIFRHCKQMYDLSKSELLEDYPDLTSSQSRQVSGWTVEYKDDYYANAED